MQQHNDYTAWMHAAMDATTRKVIKQTMDIIEDADKQFNSTELERMCRCWAILAHIEQIKHMHAEAAAVAEAESMRAKS